MNSLISRNVCYLTKSEMSYCGGEMGIKLGSFYSFTEVEFQIRYHFIHFLQQKYKMRQVYTEHILLNSPRNIPTDYTEVTFIN